MDCSINKYMRVGLIYGMAYPMISKGEGPILETLKRLLTDEYFNALEITWIKNNDIRKSAKKMLEASHMTVTYGAHPRLLTTGLNINDMDEFGRQKALETLKEGIDEAYEMGAEAFTFLSGRYEENKEDEAFNLLLKSTKELCGYASAKGNLKIILEAFDNRIDKKSLIGPAWLAKKLAKEITGHYDNFGLTVDLSHIPLIGETYEEAVLPVKKYLMHAHIGNCVLKDPLLRGYGDVHPRFGYPGGENDTEQLAAFLRVLLKIGFLNEKCPPVVSFEVKPFEDEDPEIVIAGSKRALNDAWVKI